MSANSMDELLLSLETRYASLCEELASVEKRLMELRRAESLCPFCGGTGVRWLRGGMYGELQQFPCDCTRRAA